ncbi:plasmodesmata-located protein 6-like [Phragmites australis]|uniref:plasmodesmata-located protein 6-like n=1 Tax=Phragmites australis TaxID=29695 RepID=UPI002D79BAAA|nr:plasmodesmata-located protein 6-like [Phragmites australis]XP_062234035.1 plasmodesmata-located protein 6-like [Phragmites australis]
MPKLLAAVMLPMLSLIVLRACTRARGADDYTAFVYAGCSQARYDPGSQYAADVDSTLSSLVNSAGYTAYANYSSPSAASTGLVGVYQCRSDLPAAVCGGCVKSAVSKLSSLCNSAAGAAVQLRACFVRYGNDSFLGRQDTTVLFKKCGGESAGDTGVVAMRDAALGALVAAAAPADEGSYRAGAAGYVQAMSQCVGDLGAKECSDCVSAAASQLKAGCGYASAGEVYLGKCYARFWSNAAAGGSGSGNGVPVGGGAGNGIGGGGAGGAGNGYAYGFVPNTYGNHDESGKTLAIIIGLVAAVAIVIIFLSFIRRAGGVGGKS